MRALAAFDRVALNPGEAKTVSLHLDLRRFQYWSVAEHRWVLAGGRRMVYVGASSRDLRLEQAVE